MTDPRLVIQEQRFDPWQTMSEFESAIAVDSRSIGATSVFIGTMRDFNEGQDVTGMTLEYYPGMTERILLGIIEQAIANHRLDDARVVHRVGTINPGEPIVLVAVWSGHRKAAFEACREIMEFLKSQAPFWKREQLTASDHRWVEKNTPG